MSKRAVIFFLIAVSVAVTWYVESTKPDLSPELKASIDEQLDKDGRIKSYVWNYNRLSVGVIADGSDQSDYAREVCGVIEAQGGKQASVEVVDVLKLQQTKGEEWERIGFAQCR